MDVELSLNGNVLSNSKGPPHSNTNTNANTNSKNDHNRENDKMALALDMTAIRGTPPIISGIGIGRGGEDGYLSSPSLSGEVDLYVFSLSLSLSSSSSSSSFSFLFRFRFGMEI